ncbi:MAG: type II secretion system protein N [Burkholderiales bacterium]
MRWQPLAIGFGLYAAGLIAMAPATLLDARLAQESFGRVRLADARGTIWAGAGRLEVRDGEGRSAYGSALAWRLSPISILRARLVYDVALGQPAARFRLAASPSRIELAGIDIRLPAEVLGLAVPKLAVLELGGEMRLQIGNLVAGSGYVQGDARLQWLDAASGLTPVSPLGQYELRIDGDGASGRLQLRTLQGPLSLDGTGGWRAGAAPALTATARVPPQYRDKLSPLLRLIAVERGPGQFDLRFPQ